MKIVICKSIEHYVPFLACFSRLVVKYLKDLLVIWSTSSELRSRSAAFLVLYQMVTITPFPFVELCYKQMYLSFIRNSKIITPSVVPLVRFMMNSIVEVFMLDPTSAYQLCFVYIRQLSIHLRNALSSQSKESFLGVYNWQFINSLKLFSAILCRFATETNEQFEEMKHLVYPITQIVIGTISLVPTPKYYPIRFLCVRILNDLNRSTGFYVPVAPFLIEVLNTKEFLLLKGKRSTERRENKEVDFSSCIKVKNTVVGTQGYSFCSFEELHDLLIDSMAVQSRAVAFPEISLPVVVALKKFMKKCKVANFNRSIAVVVDKIAENSKFINEARRKIDVSPANWHQIPAWIGEGKKTPMEVFAERKKSGGGVKGGQKTQKQGK